MKPSVTLDERGAILHLTNDAGEGVAVPLNAETLTELGSQISDALEQIKQPETRGAVLWNIGRAVVRELVKKR